MIIWASLCSIKFLHLLCNVKIPCLSWWNMTPFRFAISDRFCSIAVFSSSDWVQHFFFNFFSCCLVKAHNSGFTALPPSEVLDLDKLKVFLTLNILIHYILFILRHFGYADYRFYSISVLTRSLFLQDRNLQQSCFGFSTFALNSRFCSVFFLWKNESVKCL